MHAREGKSAPLLLSTSFGGASDLHWLTPLLLACPGQGDLHLCTCAMVYRSSECFQGGASDTAEEEIHTASKELQSQTFCPTQNGHPVFLFLRVSTFGRSLPAVLFAHCTFMAAPPNQLMAH